MTDASPVVNPRVTDTVAAAAVDRAGESATVTASMSVKVRCDCERMVRLTDQQPSVVCECGTEWVLKI